MKKMKVFQISGALLCLLLLTGCGSQVLTQSVPVSTNPMGAQVFVDGQAVGNAPMAVDLARNADHIVTLTKDGYRQVDVPVKRKYQQEKVLMKAVSSGVSTGNFLDNAVMGLESGVSSMDSQESTGEAYVLVPSTIAVTLQPVGGHAAAAKAMSLTDALASMDDGSFQKISEVLEKTPSGQHVRWTAANGITYEMIPEPGVVNGTQTTRSFALTAEHNGQRVSGRYTGLRAGAMNWQIIGAADTPATVAMSGAGDDTVKMSDKQVAGELLKLGAVAAASASPVTGSTGSSHTKSHESFGPGSYTKTSTKTSTSASVSVNPAGALNALGDLIEGSEK